MESMDSRDLVSPTKETKNIYLYKAGDYNFEALRLTVSPKKYNNMDSLLTDLSSKMSFPFGVRKLTTPRGHHKITKIDQLLNDGKYICSSHSLQRGMDISHIQHSRPWRNSVPSNNQRRYNFMDSPMNLEMNRTNCSFGSLGLYLKAPKPKKVTVIMNGEPTLRHIILLNSRTTQTFEKVMSDLSDMFNVPLHRLYTVDGKRISKLTSLFNGPDILIVSGSRKFIPMNTNISHFSLPTTNISPKLSIDRLTKHLLRDKKFQEDTEGNWKMKIKTKTHPNSGSDAQIMVTVYGKCGVSPTIALGSPGENHFNMGQVDEFQLKLRKIGEIYKIRLTHDNIGENASWLCEEVKMKDMNTGEILKFPCNKWLSSNCELGELIRELPAMRKGIAPYPVLDYQVSVTVGDVWNGGSTANIYLTVYGEMGDSGVRQFPRMGHLLKGQVHNVYFEAVCLGSLRKITVGHDGTGNGSGFFLEKIEIKEMSHTNDTYLFYSGKWLDDEEDDGKTFRDIHVCFDSYSTILEHKIWQAERWKYDAGNCLVLYNKSRGQPVRIMGNSGVDVFCASNEAGRGSVQVRLKSGHVCTLSSIYEPSCYLAIERNQLISKNKNASECELEIHMKADRSVTFESVKYPHQFITFLDNGFPGPARCSPSELGAQFFVMFKDVFTVGNVIMFHTSLSQTMSLEDGKSTVHAMGDRSHLAHFIVGVATDIVQSSAGNITARILYTFESVTSRGNFLRITEDFVDCQGQEDEITNQFQVDTQALEGYVLLLSAIKPQLYVGMTYDGWIEPLPIKSLSNIKLWPEVVEYSRKTICKSLQVSASEIHRRNNYSPTMLTNLPRELTSTPKDEAVISKGNSGKQWRLKIRIKEGMLFGELPVLFVILCGTDGESKAISLETDSQSTTLSLLSFLITTPDIGSIKKIRLCLLGQRKIQWNLCSVALFDASDSNLLAPTSDMAIEVSDTKDGVMEIAALDPSFNRPLVTYHVYTIFGDMPTDTTSTKTYVVIRGTEGTMGRRLLKASSHESIYSEECIKKIENNESAIPPKWRRIWNSLNFENETRDETDIAMTTQLNLFTIQAVSVGDITGIEIGHQQTDQGWFLKKVIVMEDDIWDNGVICNCQDWFDSGKGDGRIARQYSVNKFSNTPEDDQTGNESAGQESGILHTTDQPDVVEQEQSVNIDTQVDSEELPGNETVKHQNICAHGFMYTVEDAGSVERRTSTGRRGSDERGTGVVTPENKEEDRKSTTCVTSVEDKDVDDESVKSVMSFKNEETGAESLQSKRSAEGRDVAIATPS